ncbi:MAG: hypothetical protein B5M51_00790 [Anaerolinea sp. 4484_236]|nr:MAG: hypothetical protein B5M51_00790 [Anaerolinea sp. 4484_236]
MQYLVRLRAGCRHGNQYEAGDEFLVDESAYLAFADKFITLKQENKTPQKGDTKPKEKTVIAPPDVVQKVADHFSVGVSELDDFSDEDILSIPGIGPASLRMVREWQML